jgi:hypothetical protein
MVYISVLKPAFILMGIKAPSAAVGLDFPDKLSTAISD